MTVSDESGIESKDMVDDDSPTAPRQKRPRASTTTPAAPAAATPAAAIGVAAAGGGRGGVEASMAGVLADTAPGAMQGASKRLELCLAELKYRWDNWHTHRHTQATTSMCTCNPGLQPQR